MGEPAGGEFSMFEHRTVACLYFIFGITGIIGNLITIFVFCREKPLHGNRGKMHIQLAVSNIMVVLGCPFSGSSAFAGKWLFGNIGCQLYGLETYTGGMGAVSFVFLLCLQRYLSTKNPDYYNTSNLSIVLSILGWLYSFGIAIGPVLGWNSYVIESSGTACGLNWEVNDWSHRSMFIVLPVVTTVMIVISVYSLKIAFTTPSVQTKNEETDADWFTDSQLNWIAFFSLVIVNIGFGPYGFFSIWSLFNHESKIAFFSLVIVNIGFGPYGFFSIWSLFNHESKMTMIASVIPPLMAKMSSIFYPIPYLVASQRFRKEYYARLLGKCCSKRD